MNEERNGSKFLGRDHHPHASRSGWPAAASSRGSRYGATDELGYHVAEDKVHVHDLQATILHLLGPRPHEADVPVPGAAFPADGRVWERGDEAAGLTKTNRRGAETQRTTDPAPPTAV